MISFFAMVAVSTFLMVRSVTRMFRSRFLNPTDFAILSTWYYTVPLAIFGFLLLNPRELIFLHSAAANPAIAMDSLRYCLVAMVALLGGQAVGRAMGAPRLATSFSIGRTGEPRAWMACAVLLAITLIGIFQFGTVEFFQGYATDSDLQGATLGIALVYFAVGSSGLVVAYALLIHRTTGNKSTFVLIGIALLFAFVILLIRAKRLEVLITLLPAVIVLLANRKSFTATTSRLAIGAVSIAGLVAIAITRVGDELDLFTLNFYLFSEGLYAGHSLPGIIARFDSNMVNYEWGGRFLSALLAFVPRFIWAGKDEIVYAGNLALEDLSPLGATSFLAEIVLQGGMGAVILCYLAMGAVFERVARFENGWNEAIARGVVPGRFIAYLILVTTFVPHFRDGIIPAVKLSMQAGVFMVILVGLQWGLKLNSPRQAHLDRSPSGL